MLREDYRSNCFYLFFLGALDGFRNREGNKGHIYCIRSHAFLCRVPHSPIGHSAAKVKFINVRCRPISIFVFKVVKKRPFPRLWVGDTLF